MHRNAFVGFASSILVTSSLFSAACVVAPEEVGTSSQDLTGACGSRGLGDVVLAAAADPRHPSTFTTSTVHGVGVGFDSYANTVRGPYIGGGKHHELVDEMVALIRSAKSEVFLQTLTIDEKSWVAHRLNDAVREVAARGVKVFLLATPLTATNLIKQQEDPRFAIIRIATLFGTSPNIQIGAWNIKGAGALFGVGLGVLHAKSIVVDGARAMVLTANVEKSTDPTDVAGGIGWFQLGMVVEGQAAAELRAEAASAWSNATTLRAPGIPPAPKPVTASGCARAIMLGRDATADSKSSADQAFLALFGAAKSLNLLTPDFNSSVVLNGDTYDGKRVSGLVDATSHAKVRVLLPYHFDQGDLGTPGQGGTNQQGANRLVAHAKNRCNVQIRWFVNENNVRTEGNVAFASHAKLTTADGQLAVVGSQNMDTQAWQESRELSVAFDDAATTRKVDAVFETAWARAGKHPQGIGYEPDAHCKEAEKCVSRPVARGVVSEDPWLLQNADREPYGCEL